MPVTRSVERNNCSRASPLEAPQQADPLQDAPQSSVEATESDKTRTGTTETDSATDATPKSTATLKGAEESRHKPARSTYSRKSQKAARLAKAKAELARLQVKLASARIAVIEAEDSDEEDSDDGEAIPMKENERRVADWIADTQKPSKEEPPVSSIPAGDIQQLAAAITLAARSTQPAPRHHFELPVYQGSHTQWLAFEAAYKETSTSYTKTENMARLRNALKGRAREAVDNLLILCAEPEEVMTSLKTRFGRPDAIALTELEQLRALSRPSDTPRELCIFANKVANSIAAIAALRREHYMYNPEVTKTIIEKLTPALRYRWYDFAAEQKETEADLIKLSRFLQREADRCSPYAQPETATESVATNRRPAKSYAVIEAPTECKVCAKQGHTPPACPQIAEAAVQERWEIAKKHSLCFRCLKLRSRKHLCQAKRCDINDCNKHHHKLLHYEAKPKEKEVVTSTWAQSNTRSYLKIVPVKITGQKGDINTFALLDDGSTVTLVDEELANKAGIKGPREPLRVEGIGEHTTTAHRSRRITLSLQGVSGTRQRISARTFTDLKIAPQRVHQQTIAGCSHLKEISTQLLYRNARPKILIGQDNWHLLIATEVRKGQTNQPVASHTPLGWVLHGVTSRSLGKQTQHIHHLSSSDDINEQLRRHFAIESMTIEAKRPRSDPETRALSLLREHTKINSSGRYETALLWNKEAVTLPNNYDNAHKRLLSTERKIDKSPELRTKYETQMNALIEKGYAERAPAEKSCRTWYLPHFPVLNAMKPGKVRKVNDAAAKTRGVSLNDHLLTGPDLLQSLPGVLMRFRQHPVAVTADIAEMFMQVKIRTEDRDALRYLWRGSMRGDNPPQEYRMTLLIFGATSSPATAIYVKNVNAKKHEKTNPAAYDAIVRCHYVDDYIQSFKTAEEAIRVACDVRDIQREACYELRQWATNNEDVAKAVGAAEQRRNIMPDEKAERVLGLVWNSKSDVLTFNLDLARLPQVVIEGKEPTKRDILRVVMSLFDPLGFASPITVRAKQILQETWRRSIDWDDNLETDLAEQWREWMRSLHALKNIEIPRCHRLYSYACNLQLHVFVDASETAYAASLYWRMTSKDGSVNVSLVLAKARVAPLKLTSIPRLELQAAVMGCRMATAVTEEHDQRINKRFFWTDSRTVTTWIRNGARTYRPYVAHRIAEIEENSKVDEWRWVPTKLNVADDATRDVPPNFDINHRWFRGPSFLYEDPKTWPDSAAELIGETGEERKTVALVSETLGTIREIVPDYKRFSRWERLLRATARVLQFVQLVKQQRETVAYKRNKKNTEQDPSWKRGNRPTITPAHRTKATQPLRFIIPLDAEDLRRAEELLVRLTQEESFDTELRSMNIGKPVSKSSRLRRLAIESLNGVMVIATRIDAVTGVDERVKRPPIIDGDHHIARLYVDYVHTKGGTLRRPVRKLVVLTRRDAGPQEECAVHEDDARRE